MGLIPVYGKNEKGRRIFLGVKDETGELHKGVHKVEARKPARARTVQVEETKPAKSKSKTRRRKS